MTKIWRFKRDDHLADSAERDENFRKGFHSAAIVLRVAFSDQESAKTALRMAQEKLVGWSLHTAFQYASGKRFVASSERLSDDLAKAQWALAHLIAKEFTSSIGWSGAGPVDGVDMARFQTLAIEAGVIEADADANR